MYKINKFIEFRNTVIESLDAQFPKLKGSGETSIEVVSYINRLLEVMDQEDSSVVVSDAYLEVIIDTMKKHSLTHVLAGFEARDGLLYPAMSTEKAIAAINKAKQCKALHEMITLTSHLIRIIKSYITPIETNV